MELKTSTSAAAAPQPEYIRISDNEFSSRIEDNVCVGMDAAVQLTGFRRDAVIL